MATTQRQQLKTLDTQPTIGAVPIRLSLDQELFVRGLIIEYDAQSKGEIVIADSEAKATTRNVHTLYGPGDVFIVGSEMYADLNAELRPFDIWVHGTRVGDRVVVSFVDITGSFI